MELFESIRRRHSYRGPFRDQPVRRADPERIVEAGIRAPSGRNAQTTSFVIVDDPELVPRRYGTTLCIHLGFLSIVQLDKVKWTFSHAQYLLNVTMQFRLDASAAFGIEFGSTCYDEIETAQIMGMPFRIIQQAQHHGWYTHEMSDLALFHEGYQSLGDGTA